jgi:hypothetical protein
MLYWLDNCENTDGDQRNYGRELLGSSQWASQPN